MTINDCAQLEKPEGSVQNDSRQPYSPDPDPSPLLCPRFLKMYLASPQSL